MNTPPKNSPIKKEDKNKLIRPGRRLEWRYFGTPYGLSYQHYQVLTNKNVGDKINELARWIYAPKLWQGIILLTKFLIKYFRKTDYIMGYEKEIFCVGIILSIVVSIARWVIPSPKKDLLKDVCRHFKENKEQFGVFKSNG